MPRIDTSHAMSKIRLDLLVQQQSGLSRSQAQGLIHTGKVSDAQGQRLDKPGQRFAEDTKIVIKEGPPYVSRGGEKLQAALDHFDLDVRNTVAIDAGASTGGFTDCLLQHGARRVYAVDVGYGQLAWTLRNDPRVTVLDRCNIRHLTADALDERPDVFTVDCSFISLRLVLEALAGLVTDTARGIVLIKPQFEAGRAKVGKGGVVRDPTVHEEVVENVIAFCEKLGFEVEGVIPSPLLGPAGNKEFLALLRFCAQRA